jgi:hypothetical protein
MALITALINKVIMHYTRELGNQNCYLSNTESKRQVLKVHIWIKAVSLHIHIYQNMR